MSITFTLAGTPANTNVPMNPLDGAEACYSCREARAVEGILCLYCVELLAPTLGQLRNALTPPRFDGGDAA